MGNVADRNRWLSEIDLDTVFAMLHDNGVTEVLYKVLPRNANSKNQVYLASDFSQLGKLPSGEVTAHVSTSTKNGQQEAVFRSALDFYWLDEHGKPRHAPRAQLIFYPQYPEVRFSGFLQGCKNPPRALWVKEERGELLGRILVLGLGNAQKIIAITLPPESPAAEEIRASEPHEDYGALKILPMPGQGAGDSFIELMNELCRIHRLGWVPSTRLDKNGNMVPCKASNCNGNTLESLLGIQSNGYALPDFKGWEVKARQVSNLDRPGTGRVTLFTPEPTGGIYTDMGLIEFMRRYGYPDTKGRSDRLNFCGIHRAGKPAQSRTRLRLILDGFEPDTGKYTSNGAIQLLDPRDNVAASWSFAKLLDHWKIKHAHAAYVPSLMRKVPDQQYLYSRHVLIAEGADFNRLLHAISQGKVFYDPGIKLEEATSPKPTSKKRSQFRVASKDLSALYESCRIVDACKEAELSG